MSVARTCYYLNFYITYIIIIKNTVLLFVYKVLKNLSNNNYFVFCQKLYYLLFTPFLSPPTHYLTLLSTISHHTHSGVKLFPIKWHGHKKKLILF